MADDQHFGSDLEANTEDLYEHAPCAHLSTLPDGTIIRANQTFFDWLGMARADILGKRRFQALLTVGARMYYETHYAPLLQIQGFVNEIALEMRRADGQARPVVASARQLRNADGKATVTRVALFDSTDRRRYERELLQARKAAEQAAQDLEAADRRKNDFIALLAHELRNPLAPIRSAVEILRQSAHASELVETTTTMMRRQVTQMGRLVDDLLDVSRISQDKLTLHRVPVDLASVVHHAVETSEPLLASAGVTFELVLPEAPIYIEADALRLAQVIGNVLNNAAKFTPRGGVVTLILEREDQAALVRVRDTGIGIDPARLGRVFERFMQAGDSSERRDGLGLGLTLAKSLVERHAGRISAESAGPGLGSEFSIRLPMLAEPLESVSRAFGPQPETPVATPRRILVVDDNKDSAETLALLLRFLGHEVQVAHDGLEAVEATAAFVPEVVLLDIGLPTLNGYEAAERIRAEATVQPVLVALTGWGQDEDRRKSSQAGFDAHLVKPVDHEVLAQLIADLSRS